MKPSATDYLAFLEAARGHEENARASGSLVDAELARLMHREAVNLRQAALYPPERCIECGGTIHSDQRQCSACGRARQSVKMGQREVINLLLFLRDRDAEAAAKYLAKAKSAASDRQKAARTKARAERRTDRPRGPAMAEEVRRRRAAGEAVASIAAWASVSADQVRKIIKGLSWVARQPGCICVLASGRRRDACPVHGQAATVAR